MKIIQSDLLEILMTILDVDESLGAVYADIFEKEGRCLVKVGTKSECEIFKNLVIKKKNYFTNLFFLILFFFNF